MTAVMLARGESFRRVLREEDGKPKLDKAGGERVLTFSKGQPLELDSEGLEAVRDDIVKGALVIAKTEVIKGKDGKPDTLAGKSDREATAKFVDESRRLAEKKSSNKAAKPKAVDQSSPPRNFDANKK
jgi:hypothetical protein